MTPPWAVVNPTYPDIEGSMPKLRPYLRMHCALVLQNPTGSCLATPPPRVVLAEFHTTKVPQPGGPNAQTKDLAAPESTQ
jgi:hypothetical protein